MLRIGRRKKWLDSFFKDSVDEDAMDDKFDDSLAHSQNMGRGRKRVKYLLKATL